MKKETVCALVSSLFVLTAVVFAIGAWIMNGQNRYSDEKTIFLDGTEQTEMQVSLSGLYPGKQESYFLHLNANMGDAFKATLVFEKKGTDTLAPYVEVEILVNGNALERGTLAEYLNGKEIDFTLAFQKTTHAEIGFVYSMGLDIGDEAQNTSADFDIILSTKR